MGEKDKRYVYVYGARCTWHGPIQEIGQTPPMPIPPGQGLAAALTGNLNRGLPACPHCKGVLFEVECEAIWTQGAEVYEAKGHPNYVAFIKWLHDVGRCWKDHTMAVGPFKEATGLDVSYLLEQKNGG